MSRTEELPTPNSQYRARRAEGETAVAEAQVAASRERIEQLLGGAGHKLACSRDFLGRQRTSRKRVEDVELGARHYCAREQHSCVRVDKGPRGKIKLERDPFKRRLRNRTDLHCGRVCAYAD